jgi:hypothetical protein
MTTRELRMRIEEAGREVRRLRLQRRFGKQQSGKDDDATAAEPDSGTAPPAASARGGKQVAALRAGTRFHVLEAGLSFDLMADASAALTSGASQALESLMDGLIDALRQAQLVAQAAASPGGASAKGGAGPTASIGAGGLVQPVRHRYDMVDGNILWLSGDRRDCFDVFGVRRGEMFRYQSGDLLGMHFVVLGVCLNGRLWRYEQSSAHGGTAAFAGKGIGTETAGGRATLALCERAVPFAARDGQQLRLIHDIVRVGTVEPRISDLFFFPKADQDSVTCFDIRDSTCEQFGVRHGVRYVCRCPPPGLVFAPPPNEYRAPLIVTAIGSDGDNIFFSVDHGGAFTHGGNAPVQEMRLQPLYSSTVQSFGSRLHLVSTAFRCPVEQFARRSAAQQQRRGAAAANTVVTATLDASLTILDTFVPGLRVGDLVASSRAVAADGGLVHINQATADERLAMSIAVQAAKAAAAAAAEAASPTDSAVAPAVDSTTPLAGAPAIARRAAGGGAPASSAVSTKTAMLRNAMSKNKKTQLLSKAGQNARGRHLSVSTGSGVEGRFVPMAALFAVVGVRHGVLYGMPLTGDTAKPLFDLRQVAHGATVRAYGGNKDAPVDPGTTQPPFDGVWQPSALAALLGSAPGVVTLPRESDGTLDGIAPDPSLAATAVRRLRTFGNHDAHFRTDALSVLNASAATKPKTAGGKEGDPTQQAPLSPKTAAKRIISPRSDRTASPTSPPPLAGFAAPAATAVAKVNLDAQLPAGAEYPRVVRYPNGLYRMCIFDTTASVVQVFGVRCGDVVRYFTGTRRDEQSACYALILGVRDDLLWKTNLVAFDWPPPGTGGSPSLSPSSAASRAKQHQQQSSSAPAPVVFEQPLDPVVMASLALSVERGESFGIRDVFPPPTLAASGIDASYMSLTRSLGGAGDVDNVEGLFEERPQLRTAPIRVRDRWFTRAPVATQFAHCTTYSQLISAFDVQLLRRGAAVISFSG